MSEKRIINTLFTYFSKKPKIVVADSDPDDPQLAPRQQTYHETVVLVRMTRKISERIKISD